jgi:hypothetical protein
MGVFSVSGFETAFGKDDQIYPEGGDGIGCDPY